MKTPRTILLICPAPRGSRKGNRITAVRWARLLRQLGHRVTIRQDYGGERCDVMIALHARRSAPAIQRFARQRPDSPLVVALTGTDLYRDIRTSGVARRSLDLASRLVVLQAAGLAEMPAGPRRKARVILQSSEPTKGRPAERALSAAPDFRVCVLGHLRREKDPFRAALATRLLPEGCRVGIIHLGAALDPAMERWARVESARNPRYHWLGEVSHKRARRLLARSDLMVLSSRIEGGANVLSEALADNVPMVASNIPSTAAILGAGYPGLYPAGDTRALARLLLHAESDPRFYRRLERWCARRAPRVTPERERAAWDRLIAELFRSP